MTIEAFIDICEKSFSEGKVKLGPKQGAIYTEKLRRFADEQRDKIFDKLLETNKRKLPLIADIYDAARDLGYLSVDTVRTREHHWQPTNCGACHGEGRLLTVWELFGEERDGRRVEVQEFRAVTAYAGPWPALSAGQFTALFRCWCPAGDARTLPSAWPKWRKDAPLRREVWK